MSKAFDTVSHKPLLEDLNPEKLHMMFILITDVKLKVKVEKNICEEIKTEIGFAQRDCLSAILLYISLQNTLIPHNQTQTTAVHVLDNQYYKQNTLIMDIIKYLRTPILKSSQNMQTTSHGENAIC